MNEIGSNNWCALSTYLRKNDLQSRKDVTPERLIKELGFEYRIGSYKFRERDLAIAVKHYKITKMKPKASQHKSIYIYDWNHRYFILVVQNKQLRTSNNLNLVLRRANVKFKEMNEIDKNLYNEDYYPLTDFWNTLKKFLEYMYDLKLLKAIREEMSETESKRILIIPQDDFTKQLINKLKQTKKD